MITHRTLIRYKDLPNHRDLTNNDLVLREAISNYGIGTENLRATLVERFATKGLSWMKVTY